MTVDIIEILKLIPNYGISIFVIWIGYKLFSEITEQIKEVNKTMARLAVLVETQQKVRNHD